MSADFEKLEERADRFLAQTEDETSPAPEVRRVYQEPKILRDDYQIMELDLDQLRKFPVLLTDVTLNSPENAELMDAYLYWAWTGAFLTDHPLQDDVNYSRIIRNLENLIQIMLLHIRYVEMSQLRVPFVLEEDLEKPPLIAQWEFFNWLIPSISRVAAGAHLYGATTGYVVLEGFVCRRCDDLTLEGDWKHGRKPTPWRPDVCSPNYQDRLQIWRYYEAEDATKWTLDRINDICRYERQHLLRTYADVQDLIKEELSGTNNFLRVLAALRNWNIHSQTHSYAIASVVVTLCCLVIWDLIGRESFEEHREHVIDRLLEDITGERPTDSPATFIPVRFG
jgi:hypothetical protein